MKIFIRSFIDTIFMIKNNEFDVFIHSCNCMHTMELGISKILKLNFSEIYDNDKKTNYGCKLKLGTYTKTNINKSIILNAYTHYRYKSYEYDIDLKALKQILENIKIEYSGKKIGIPIISDHKDFKIVYKIIKEELKDENVILVIPENLKKLLFY